MKKLILYSSFHFLFLFFFLSLAGLAQKNDSMHVYIWADNLACHKQTADDILDADGRGDEAIVQYFFFIVNADNGTVVNRLTKANLDIRLLTDGTNYPLNKPLFSQYPIKENEILVVIPVVWEEDRYVNRDVMTPFISNMNSCIDMIAAQLPALYNTFRTRYNNSLTGHYTGISVDMTAIRNISWRSFTGLPSFKTLLAPVRDGAGTRPVGMDANRDYTPAIFTISRGIMKYLAIFVNDDNVTREARFGLGFDENALGNTANHGVYSMNLKLQVAHVPAAASSSGKTGIIGSKTPGIIKNTVYSITGNWQGQWSTGINPLRMKLDDAGFLELYNSNNSVAARGTYTLSNDQFFSKFTLNGKNYELSGTLNKTNNTLSGIWRQTNSITNENGSWSMTKQ